MSRPPSISSAVITFALVACGKSSNETKQTPAPPPSSGSSAGSATGSADGSSAEPVEAAAVVGPVKSATGTLEVTGTVAGTFEWKKKDQRSPITCVWDPEKEIGSLRIDVSDGAGHLLSLGVDVPPSEVGPGRIEISSKDLASPLKTYAGFKIKGEEATQFTVAFDDAQLVTDPDEQLKSMSDKKKKSAEPPAGPYLALKGALDVSCPKKN